MCLDAATVVDMKRLGFGEAIGIIVWKVWYPSLIRGHQSHAATYDFPVRMKFMENWEVPTGREDLAGYGWNLPEYIRCARELEGEGVAAITTNCGLTGTMQEELANAVHVPVFTSCLLQVPMVTRMLRRDQKVGIVVSSEDFARANDFRLLRSCGIDESTPFVLVGMDESEHGKTWISQYDPKNADRYDPGEIQDALVHVVTRMVADNPEIGALVLECTEMPLYADAVREATGLPAFDSASFVRYVHQAIVKPG
jgi:Asp/Glu/hydantoin racemase